MTYFAVLGLTVAALTGCQSKSAANRQPYNGSATAVVVNGMQQVTLTVSNSFRFSPSTFTVHPGQVKVVLHHTGVGAPHDWQLITGIPGNYYIPLVSQGQTAEVTFTAPSPGKYQFQCTIHLKQGMTGTMIVVPN